MVLQLVPRGRRVGTLHQNRERVQKILHDWWGTKSFGPSTSRSLPECSRSLREKRPLASMCLRKMGQEKGHVRDSVRIGVGEGHVSKAERRRDRQPSPF